MNRKIFLIATEESGDRLGANLMKVLRQRLGGAVQFEGVGGRAMAVEGLTSRFPIEELSIIGLAAVVRQLPAILRRIRETAEAAVASQPDILVIIDSPDFTHRVAKRVRAMAPHIPIVDYVSPTVWAWRSGRARAMKPYIDHVLALPAVATAAVGTGGQYTGGQNVIYGLTYVDTEGRDTPMSRLPAVTTVGPTGSVNITNLPATYGAYMGLRVYRSLNGGQFDLIGLVDSGANSFTDIGKPLAQAQTVPATVGITVAQAPIVPSIGGFLNGMRVNYRFSYVGPAGETASALKQFRALKEPRSF